MSSQHLTGYPSTFIGLFGASEYGRPAINSIEIPIIQRDFAQGRPDHEASTIRERFLDAIVHACLTDTPLALDFVYGEVRDGVLRPLDGQQRLTTLFLLHWYVASLADTLEPSAPWLRFSYATRPTARDFCELLAHNPFPQGSQLPSEWITDQPWYVYPWRQDPTISSMLVMLDAMHQGFDGGTVDFSVVWSRLADQICPAIWFLFLPVADMDHGEDLYIKMNSRGKPLSSFEVFKADLEGMMEPVLRGVPCPVDGHQHDQYEHLTLNIDGAWTDTLWQYERAGEEDFVVDDEFMRYLAFVIDICEWRDGVPSRRWRDSGATKEISIEERARLAFVESSNEFAERNRKFFFHAFDTWSGLSPQKEFSKLFAAGSLGEGPLPLLVSTSPDLFSACIATYGSEFSLAESLMLFAVLLSRQGDGLASVDRDRRLRTLRNLAESAFIDRKRMVEYVGAVERLIVQGTLDKAQAFNAEWTADELEKWKLEDESPEVSTALRKLEDLPVIRGRLLAFELDATTIPGRADTFESVAHPTLRDSLGAALLTKADYSRDVGWGGTRRQLGSSTKDDSWRDLFTAGSRASVRRTRVPLMELLDDVGARMRSTPGMTSGEALTSIRRDWLSDRESESHFDWRYYLVRYDGARSSVGEGYFHNDGYDATHGGFSYGGLRILHGSSYTAYFSDALLRAAWLTGDLARVAYEPKWWHRDDPGMEMIRSGLEVRCLDDAFELVCPPGDDEAMAQAIRAIRSIGRVVEGRLIIEQSEIDGAMIDRQDRVLACVGLVRTLHAAGL